MSKFNVGDKVRVSEFVNVGDSEHGVLFIGEMIRYKGEELTIEEVNEHPREMGIYKYYVKENGWTWVEEWFEPVNEEENGNMNEEIKTIMIKDVEPYVPTESEMKYLLETGMDLLRDYNYNPTENGLRAIYDEWATNNAWMIKLFEKSPNYVNGKFYIKLPATKLVRPVDKAGVNTFVNWARETVREVLTNKYRIMIGLHTFSDYERAKNRVLNKYNSMLQGMVWNGETENSLLAEYNRMKDRIDQEYAKQTIYCCGDDYVPREIYITIENVKRIFAKVKEMENPQIIGEDDARKFNELLEDTIIKARAHEGNKTTKFYGKIMREIGMDKVVDIKTERWTDQDGVLRERTKDMGYNYHRALLGDSINPYTYDRDIIISVNPIDYWTMSFGYRWASCHTIDKTNRRNCENSYHGEYSGGTESYMLDGSSFIVYVLPTAEEIENKGETLFADEKKSKLKRCVFMMGEDKLVQSRVYPDGRDGGDDGLAAQLRNIVQKVIADLLETPNMWRLEKGRYECQNVTRTIGVHYADYDCCDDCNVSYLRRIDGYLNRNRITIGHDPICPCCGEEHDAHDNIQCYDCGEEMVYCERCGDSFREEDGIRTNDGTWFCCGDCANRSDYVYCTDVEEWYHIDYCHCDDYEGEWFYYEDEAVYSEEGYVYRNEYNAEADGCRWCEDIERYSQDYYETVEGNYFYSDSELIEIDGEYYESEEDAINDGYELNEDGEWVVAA